MPAMPIATPMSASFKDRCICHKDTIKTSTLRSVMPFTKHWQEQYRNGAFLLVLDFVLVVVVIISNDNVETMTRRMMK